VEELPKDSVGLHLQLRVRHLHERISAATPAPFEKTFVADTAGGGGYGPQPLHALPPKIQLFPSPLVQALLSLVGFLLSPFFLFLP
jgi:hypothetical protein